MAAAAAAKRRTCNDNTHFEEWFLDMFLFFLVMVFEKFSALRQLRAFC